MSFEPSDVFAKAPQLEVNQVPDGYVVYQTERDHVHYLNPLASVIFELCEPENCVADIGELVKDAYQLDAIPEEEVATSLARFLSEGLIVSCAK